MGEHSLSDHRILIDAMATGNAAHAEAVMRRHMRDGKQRLMALPDNAFR